jgi:hypothetical protein
MLREIDIPLSYEDVLKMIETCMVISALLLSFSIAGMQSVSHDDLVEGDKRWALAFGRPGDTSLFLPSVGLLQRI